MHKEKTPAAVPQEFFYPLTFSINFLHTLLGRKQRVSCTGAMALRYMRSVCRLGSTSQKFPKSPKLALLTSASTVQYKRQILVELQKSKTYILVS